MTIRQLSALKAKYSTAAPPGPQEDSKVNTQTHEIHAGSGPAGYRSTLHISCYPLRSQGKECPAATTLSDDGGKTDRSKCPSDGTSLRCPDRNLPACGRGPGSLAMGDRLAADEAPLIGSALGMDLSIDGG